MNPTLEPQQATTATHSRLEPFFIPRRIAVVGASERGLYPAGLLRSLLDGGFSGEIYPVNLRRETVFGLPCYAELAQTPLVPDLAILVIPRRFVLPVLRECIALGVPAALVITAGFGEADEEGRRLQAELTALVAGTPLAVIGPNCAGLANIQGRVIATVLTALPRAGGISLVSQSGALMMALAGLFAERQLGVNRLISLGNQVDVSLAESVAYLALDEETAVIAAFVEGVQDGRRFISALQAALAAAKPVVLLKSGRTDVGQAAVRTHTAALAGSDRVFSAVCKQFGVIQVDDINELVDTAQVLEAFGRRLSGSARIMIVSQSGGLGALTADMCWRAGLSLSPLGVELKARLSAMAELPQSGAFSNPCDVRGAALVGEPAERTLSPFLHDPESDLVILLLAKSTLRAGEDETAEAIVRAYNGADKPLLVVWVGQRTDGGERERPPATERLAAAGIPTFDGAGRAVKALGRVVAYRRFHEAWPARAQE